MLPFRLQGERATTQLKPYPLKDRMHPRFEKCEVGNKDVAEELVDCPISIAECSFCSCDPKIWWSDRNVHGGIEEVAEGALASNETGCG
jgi:hypothetical protein